LSAIAIKYNDEIVDLVTAKERGIEGEAIELDNSAESLEVLRHSTAHLMAQAIKSLYPDAEFYVGPTVKEGFYYDFKTESEIGEGDLKKIEKQMLSFAKKKYKIDKYSISMD
jgi:threonyl-tRNA synthetase